MEKLTLESLKIILENRFPNGFLSLSQLPHPSLLKDSTKSAERIAKAIKNNEKIVIIGDYDVDGVISSAIASLFFKEINYPIEIVIPNRFSDGYGITPELLNRVSADLVITVDNGINSFRSAEILKNRGTDLIITDHHRPADSLPNAFAVINPKRLDCEYPLKDICGAQIFWLLLGEIKRELNLNIDLGQYLDLIAIAIIGDVMPLRGFNHLIVKMGLKKMFALNNSRISMKILKDKVFASKNIISSEDIAFQISPRINSSGRISDASFSLNFILAETEYEANSLLNIINEFNNTRKDIEYNIFKKVLDEVDSSNSIIIYCGEDLHEGVVGIVANRIVEKFNKPAFILSQKGDIIKGSARGIGNIDIYKLIENGSKFLLRWGGHKKAGGLSLKVENFENFQNSLLDSMKIYKETDFINKKDIFGELDLKYLSKELIILLDNFEPYGEGNERPTFLARDMFVLKAYNIGKSGEYQKLIVRNNNIFLEALLFKIDIKIEIGAIISFLYRPISSIFKGEEKIQLMIQQIIN